MGNVWIKKTWRGGNCWYLFFQAEDGIRDLVRSRGLGDVYKRQHRHDGADGVVAVLLDPVADRRLDAGDMGVGGARLCLLYTSDAADDPLCVDLGGRRITKKKTHNTIR